MARSNVLYLGAADSSWTALVERYRRSVPTPINSVAAALVDGFRWAYGSDDAAFARFKGVGGKLDRLAWSAAGYRRPGDRFRAATDAKWWAAPYADAAGLYGTLLAWAQALDQWDAAHGKAGPTGEQLAQWDVPLASGSPDAIANFLGREWEGLKQARASGVEPPGPGIPPIRQPPGGGVPPAPTKPPSPTLPTKPLPTPLPGVPGPSWVGIALVVGAIYLLTRE